MGVGLELRLADHTPAVAERLALWEEQDMGRRLWARDPTIWSPRPQRELADRLGWLDLPTRALDDAEDLDAFGEEVAAARFEQVVVLGMGGSSLAPQVFAATFGRAPGSPELLVLDSTHPAAVDHLAQRIEPSRTLFIVSSKSGTTLETISLFRFFWNVVAKASDEPGRHFMAVTDPGTELALLGEAREFRHVFLAPTEVGGRFSALSEFGLVPAAAAGIDTRALAAGAAAVAGQLGPGAPVLSNSGFQLGAALGELALAGIDKVTLLTDAPLAAFPPWIEQLVAESTGKSGTGIVPIPEEEAGLPQAYGTDRFFLVVDTADDGVDTAPLTDAGHPVARLRLDGLEDLGGAMFMLEVAVAMAGSVLGINPFDQPDVQLAKELAIQAVAGGLDTSDVARVRADDDGLADNVASWVASIKPGDYAALQAFIEPTEAARAALEQLRRLLQDHRKVATTVHFGPRFLHSTGQLHKGGPESGIFLQIIDEPAPYLPVPETGFDFGGLVVAQALGDHQALRRQGRRVMLVDVGNDVGGGLAAVIEAVRTALG